MVIHGTITGTKKNNYRTITVGLVATRLVPLPDCDPASALC